MRPPAAAKGRNTETAGSASRTVSAASRSLKLMKKPSVAITSPPAFSSAIFANTTSKSRSFSASTICRFSPNTAAAAKKLFFLLLGSRIGRADEGGDGPSPWHNVMQQLQPLAFELHAQRAHAGEIAARVI